MLLAEHLSDSAGAIGKAGEQDQPESAHGNVAAHLGQAGRSMGDAGRVGEFRAELLCQGGNSAPET